MSEQATEEQRIVIQKTTKMKTAAVMISKRFPLIATNTEEAAPLISFHLAVPLVREDEAEGIMRKCDNGLNVQVHVGQYEAAIRDLRRLIREHQEERKHDQRQSREAAG